MKFPFKIVIPLAVIAASVCCLIFCRSIPVARIWNNYQVLYVSNKTDEKTVLDYLHDAGCRDVISLSEQHTPLFSPYTPVEKNGGKDAYLVKRLSYFTDKTNAYRLFYIPESYEHQTAKAVTALSKELGIKAGLDGTSSYPWLVPIICCVLFLVFLLFSKNKMVFAAAAIFPVLLTWSKPFYPNAAGIILLLLAILLSERYWKREGALKLLCSNMYILALGVCSLVTVFSSLQSGLLYILMLCASVAMLLLYRKREIKKDDESSFTFSLIIPAKMMPVMYKKASGYLLLSATSLFILFLLFMTSARFIPQISVNGLSIPSPVPASENSSTSEIPSLNDYFVWAWNTITFPYRNLNDKEDAGQPPETIKYPEYKNSDRGIVEYTEIPYQFNNDFMNTAEKSIDGLEYPAIEKLMKKQGRNVNVSYVEKSSGNTKDAKSLVFILISMVIPILLYLYYTISGRRKYENSK